MKQERQWVIRVEHERIRRPAVVMAIGFMHNRKGTARMQDPAMDIVGQDFPARIEPADVLDDLPRQGQGSRGLEERGLEQRRGAD